MYNLLTSKFLVNGQNKSAKLLNNKFCNFKEQLDSIPKISKECNQFLIQMLEKNPKNRLSIDEALKHEWLREYKSEIYKCLNKSKSISKLKKKDHSQIRSSYQWDSYKLHDRV